MQSDQLHDDGNDVILLHIGAYGTWFALLLGEVKR